MWSLIADSGCSQNGVKQSESGLKVVYAKADEEITAMDLIKKYGHAQGELKRLIEAGEVSRLHERTDATERQYLIRQDRNAYKVTEYLIGSEVYRIGLNFHR